ncbi:hypothetical protein JAAARDRAFT_78515 [Jaapia argillacea MUCL 33604]|uniref:Uncharacterized protein n=1 Tax=Jaapia argillacea MUCL 33604 TaxID=933084 RepID=A0A067PW72_9AGAM|nr:hypothetical protein JAAARDRAFT_78515 [Jaapia argillacea MUCL 33604]
MDVGGWYRIMAVMKIICDTWACEERCVTYHSSYASIFKALIREFGLQRCPSKLPYGVKYTVVQQRPNVAKNPRAGSYKARMKKELPVNPRAGIEMPFQVKHQISGEKMREVLTQITGHKIPHHTSKHLATDWWLRSRSSSFENEYPRSRSFVISFSEEIGVSIRKAVCWGNFMVSFPSYSQRLLGSLANDNLFLAGLDAEPNTAQSQKSASRSNGFGSNFVKPPLPHIMHQDSIGATQFH